MELSFFECEDSEMLKRKMPLVIVIPQIIYCFVNVVFPISNPTNSTEIIQNYIMINLLATLSNRLQWKTYIL